jgi:hypothetical protein
MNDAAIWLYGSVARGTDSEASDLDILVVQDSQEPQALPVACAALARADHLSLRHYSWREIEGMASYGSLFLLHLKLEGCPLVENWSTVRMRTLLTALPPYTGKKRDLQGFTIALGDVAQSASDEGDPAFELSVLATVFRHASILGCYLMDEPAFDRDISITRALTAVGMLDWAEGAVSLYEHRLALARNIPPRTPPTVETVIKWHRVASEFISRLGDL